MAKLIFWNLLGTSVSLGRCKRLTFLDDLLELEGTSDSYACSKDAQLLDIQGGHVAGFPVMIKQRIMKACLGRPYIQGGEA